MIFDLANVVSRFTTHTLSVARPAHDTFDAYGRAHPRTAESTFTAHALVYPKDTHLKRDDAVGFSPSETWTVLTTTPLRVRDVVRCYALGTDAYEVEFVDAWTDAAGYCSATMRRRQGPFEGGTP